MKKKNLIIICASALAVVVATVVILVIALGGNKEHECEFTNYVSNGEVLCTVDKTSTAICNHDGCDKTDTRVDEAAKAHSYAAAIHVNASCEAASHTVYKCSNCPDTYEESTTPATGHNYVVYSHTEVSCENDEKTVYKCSGCDDSYEVISQEATGHSIFAWNQEGDAVLKTGTTCEYTQTYVGRCGYCLEKVEKEVTVHIHDYVAKVTSEATCQTTGVKTYTCSLCQDSVTEEYENTLAHTWDNGTVNGAVTTYACINNGCTHTKTAIVAKTEVSTNVSTENLSGNEVELKNASIALDSDTLADLGSADVTLSADTVEDTAREEVVNALTEEQKAQLGDNTIYNFSMEQDGSQVSTFSGKVTVTIPYTLEANEDPNNIGIWYLADDGTVETIAATYANGFVSFETSHFSYYSVTRLTPAERCALYGHINNEVVVEETCVTDGYTITICRRCAQTNKTNIVPATGHTYTEVTEPATCTTHGKTTHTCLVCNNSYVKVLPATGHSWEVTEKVDATVEAAGHITYTCGTCQATKETILPKLEAVPVELTNADIVEKVLENLSGHTITLKLTDFELKLAEGEILLPIYEGYISLDENENLNGYFIVKQSMIDGLVSQDSDTRVYILENKAYVKNVSSQGGYVKYTDWSYNDLSVATENSDIDMEQLEAMLQQVATWYEDSFSKVVDKVSSTNSVALKELKEDIVNTIFDVEENLDGYTISLNLDEIDDLLTYLTTHTIYDILEKVVGKAILEDVTKLLNYSVGDLITYVEAKGFVLSEVIASLDELVKVMMADYEVETLEELLQMYMDNPEFDIEALLANEDLRAYRIVDVILPYVGEEATYDDVKTMLEGYIAQTKDVKLLDLVMMYMGQAATGEEENPMETMITEGISYLANILEGVNVKVVSDSDFVIKDIKLTVNLTSEDLASELIPEDYGMPEAINIELSVLLDYQAGYDLSNIKTEVDTFISNLFVEENAAKIFSAELYRAMKMGYLPVGEGNNVKLVKDDTNETVIDQGEIDANSYYQVVAKESYKGQIDLDLLKTATAYSIDVQCGDWYNISFNVDIPVLYTTSETKYIYSTVDNSLISEEEVSSNTKEKTDNIYFDLYFNTKTKEVTGEYVTHDYVEDMTQFKEAEGCEGLGRHVYTCAECGQVAVSYYRNGHDGKLIEATLIDGVSCEGGATYTIGCNNCDWTETNEVYGHTTFATKYAISDLGGHCDGYVVLSKCLCEINVYVYVDSECDFDYENVYDETTEEWIYYRTCSLTDPLCGFAYAYTYEDVQDATNQCKVTRYAVYYLGITGTDITTAKQTIRYMSYVDYEHTFTKVDAESVQEENYQKLVYKCSYCDAKNIIEEWYDANGNTTKLIEIEERPEYDSKNYDEYTYADVNTGSYDSNSEEYVLNVKQTHTYHSIVLSTNEVEYGYTETYTYSFNGECKRSIRTQYLDGSSNYKEENFCNYHNYSTYNYVDGGCTQDSYYLHYCQICHTMDQEYIHVSEHYWYWNSDLGLYVCDECGLESVTGADGVIVLEDATDYESNPTEFKIGYYVKNNLEHMVYVSIILNDAEDGENDQVVFDDIEIKYADPSEGRYVLVSIEEVVNAITDGGYADRDYSIRITFVPVNYQDDLDYSITIE